MPGIGPSGGRGRRPGRAPARSPSHGIPRPAAAGRHIEVGTAAVITANREGRERTSRRPAVEAGGRNEAAPTMRRLAGWGRHSRARLPFMSNRHGDDNGESVARQAPRAGFLPREGAAPRREDPGRPFPPSGPHRHGGPDRHRLGLRGHHPRGADGRRLSGRPRAGGLPGAVGPGRGGDGPAAGAGRRRRPCPVREPPGPAPRARLPRRPGAR